MKFKVEQYEIHVTTLMVEASSQARAVAAVYAGDGECIGGPDYVCVAEDWGMSTASLSDEDIEELQGMDCLNHRNCIISIRSIEREG